MTDEEKDKEFRQLVSAYIAKLSSKTYGSFVLITGVNMLYYHCGDKVRIAITLQTQGDPR